MARVGWQGGQWIKLEIAGEEARVSLFQGHWELSKGPKVCTDIM